MTKNVKHKMTTYFFSLKFGYKNRFELEFSINLQIRVKHNSLSQKVYVLAIFFQS